MDKWLETRQFQVHFVSAAGLVYKDDKVLLIKSKKRGWELPGGVVEQGESILDGIKREIFEESGVTAKPENMVGIYRRLSSKAGYGPLEGMVLPTTVNLTFICRYVGGKETATDESIEVDWFAPDEAKEKIEEQIYYFYAMKLWEVNEILKQQTELVIHSKNQVLISYYFIEGWFSLEQVECLKQQKNEEL